MNIRLNNYIAYLFRQHIILAYSRPIYNCYKAFKFN